MKTITVINRVTGEEEAEQVYGESALRFLYGEALFCRFCKTFVSRSSLFSRFYGLLQKTSFSRRKIKPFIKRFQIDEEEFKNHVDHFRSFNDFFIRKLKPEKRLIAPGDNVAVMPADGRYLFFPNVSSAEGFYVKQKKFNLHELLQNSSLAEQYSNGTMVIARLCPTDYHRFHFPVDCIPDKVTLINGYLYSVNPMALKKNIRIFTQNKRMLCELDSPQFGKVLFIEVGATSVGSIQQTYTPGKFYHKGEEKGYLSFGGSSIIMLFQPGKITLDADLLLHPYQEIRCLMGQSLGKNTPL